jgi:hypothetical protein
VEKKALQIALQQMLYYAHEEPDEFGNIMVHAALKKDELAALERLYESI